MANSQQSLESASDFEFTNNWFGANEEDWRVILKNLQPKRALEVGSFEGRSACFLIQEAFSLELMTCIDTWQGGRTLEGVDMTEVERRFERNTQIALADRNSRPSLPACQLEKRKQTSFSSLMQLQTRQDKYDLAYIDGSHTPEDVLSDCILALRLLRVGGVMILDDYLWHLDPDGDDLLDTPKLAHDAFTSVFRRYVAFVPRRSFYQLYLVKTQRLPGERP